MPSDNLFVRAFAAAGADPRGSRFAMTNAVPFARGLGSSAATIAAGVLAGRAWQGDHRDPFPLAVELEGHPDNVAAALYGGMQLSWKTARGPQTVRLGPAPVEFVAVIPPYELSTEQARAAIPPQVPLFDAVYTAARAALLVAAVEQGRPELLVDALDDRLHEPYRAPLVPLLATVRERCAISRARGHAVGRRPDGARVGRAGIGHRRGRRVAGTRSRRGADATGRRRRRAHRLARVATQSPPP